MGNEPDNFLRKALKDCKYSFPDRTRMAALGVLTFYNGLKPHVTDFVFGNGMSKKLVALKGTIPMFYRGSTYHIPIEVYLLHTHPENAPIVYVRPTPNMQIKSSRNVDNSGKIYLPFLHSWKADSGLMQLIQVLIRTFEEQPPVFAVPTQPVAQPMPPSPALGATSTPYPLQQSAAYPTPYPPYPGGVTSTSMPMPPAMPQMPQQLFPSQPSSTDTLTVHIRASLLSAVGEKLRRRLEDIYFATQIETQTCDQLKEGATRLESLIKDLDTEKESVSKSISQLETMNQELDEKIQQQSNQEVEPLVDEAIQAPTPLYKQIVTAFAEEAAVEDTIYNLSEAFRSGKMELDIFQRHLRILARKQFMLRAVLRRCRQKAGLAG